MRYFEMEVIDYVLGILIVSASQCEQLKKIQNNGMQTLFYSGYSNQKIQENRGKNERVGN